MSIFRGKTKQEVYLASQLYDSIDDISFSAVKTLLCENNANPNIIVPIKGISPFHLVIGSDDGDFALKITSLILQYGGDPNVSSDDGLTPVHIAAAWGRIEILQLLLSCGGDPESRDSNWMTPINYAKKENYFDCLDLLRSYLPNNYDIINKEKRDCYKFKFDKILVNNGYITGEYEIDKNLNINNIKTQNSIIYTKQCITKDEMLELANLPKPDSTKLVLNWFNTHIEDRGGETYVRNTETTTEEDFISLESSKDESDNESSMKCNISLKKAYKKKRKIKTPKIVAPNTQPSLIISESDLNQSETQKYSTKEIFSDESGIVTLAHSKNSFSSTNSAVKNREVSSDYMTSSDTSLLNKNIFTLANEFSLLTSDESCVEKSKIASENKSEDMGSTELSFVTVSEVYKYEDKEEGIVLYEKRMVKVGSECNGSMSSKMSSLPESLDYDPVTLRRELTLLGYDPGPITFTTKRVYLKKLYQLKKLPMNAVMPEKTDNTKKVYSPELEKTLKNSNWTSDLAGYKKLEELVIGQFSVSDPSRKWREGNNKSSFTYLLLDPRKTDNLPCRAEIMEPKDVWETFLSAIFYVGKGKRTRPYSHLYEAVSHWKQSKFSANTKKIQTILDIWRNDTGVICLHVFQNVIPVEAYTREAAMISALKMENISNLKNGEFYGIASTWGGKEKRMLGTFLLYKAMKIFLNEGERQLYPEDID